MAAVVIQRLAGSGAVLCRRGVGCSCGVRVYPLPLRSFEDSKEVLESSKAPVVLRSARCLDDGIRKNDVALECVSDLFLPLSPRSLYTQQAYEVGLIIAKLFPVGRLVKLVFTSRHLLISLGPIPRRC